MSAGRLVAGKGTAQVVIPAQQVLSEHGQAARDVVPQPLVVKDELANGLRGLVTLPPALESPCALRAVHVYDV